MSPEQAQINELKGQVETLERQMREFLSASELSPQIVRTIKIVNNSITKDSTSDTTGTLKAVSESGVSSYSVANAYAGTLIVSDLDGNDYKLGYYTA